MSDQGKFINTYIDVLIGTIHETLNSTFQLKTQLKIANDLLAEKDDLLKSEAIQKAVKQATANLSNFGVKNINPTLQYLTR